MPHTKHGFKKENSKASPSKPPKVYDDYVYDIGDRLTGSDLDNRIERFEATYQSTRPEYQGFSFVGTDKKTIVVPPEVARSIHAHCEFQAHPITANQKIQPNYVKANVRNREPDKVGNLKVSSVGYYNRVQQHIGLPNYNRIKSMAIQKALFQDHLMYKEIGKREDYPACADIDYSKQVLARVHKELSTTTQYGKTCGGSRLMEAATDREALATALPDILCYAPDDVKERKQKALAKTAEAKTAAQSKQPRKSSKQRVQFNLQQPRRSPRNENKTLSRSTSRRGKSVKRKLGDALELDDKPKLLSDDSSDDEFDGNNDNDDEFDWSVLVWDEARLVWTSSVPTTDDNWYGNDQNNWVYVTEGRTKNQANYEVPGNDSGH